jgi:hypothetical protein
LDLAERGALPLIELSLAAFDKSSSDENALGSSSSSSSNLASKNACLVSVALALICSRGQNALLISAVSDLLLLPVVVQCLSFEPVCPSASSTSRVPPLDHITIPDIMSNPITRHVELLNDVCLLRDVCFSESLAVPPSVGFQGSPRRTVAADSGEMVLKWLILVRV